MDFYFSSFLRYFSSHITFMIHFENISRIFTILPIYLSHWSSTIFYDSFGQIFWFLLCLHSCLQNDTYIFIISVYVGPLYLTYLNYYFIIYLVRCRQIFTFNDFHLVHWAKVPFKDPFGRWQNNINCLFFSYVSFIKFSIQDTFPLISYIYVLYGI